MLSVPCWPKHAALAAVLAVASALLIGCGPANCDEEAKQAEATSGAEQAKKVRATCERRLADMRERLKRDQAEREAAERRNSFTNRADAHGDRMR